MLPATVKENFIDILMETGNVSEATRRLGINRMTAYGWRDDPVFAEMWDVALEVSRQRLRESVVETASYMGLGHWMPVADDQTGEPVLDDDFEPIMQFEIGHVDARVLMKLMDKTMRDEVRRVDQRTAVAGRLEHHHAKTEIVIYSPDGEVIEADSPGEVAGD